MSCLHTAPTSASMHWCWRSIELKFSVLATCLLDGQKAGLGPPADLLSGVPESRQRARPLLPTSLRLSLRATCAVKLLGLCGPTHCVPAALRSDKRPQVRARSCCTLRCSSQPQELAVTGVGTRGNTGSAYQIASSLNLIAATAVNVWT